MSQRRGCVKHMRSAYMWLLERRMIGVICGRWKNRMLYSVSMITTDMRYPK